MRPYEPEGIDFLDLATGRRMKLVTEGHAKGWIVYRHPDGRWVILRRATETDIAALRSAPGSPTGMIPEDEEVTS